MFIEKDSTFSKSIKIMPITEYEFKFYCRKLYTKLKGK